MQNRKSRKKTQKESPYSKSGSTGTVSRFNIKFQLNKLNLECFIGEKRQNKKTVPKRSQSRKMRKPSQKKKAIIVMKEEKVGQKSVDKKRVGESPDIVREASNSILSKIESKGIKYEWKQLEQTVDDINQHEEEVSQSSEIWSVFSADQSIQKSYASTMDYQQSVYYHSLSYQEQNYVYQPKQVSPPYEGNIYEVRIDYIGYDPRTTIMIRNIPNKYTIKDLSQEIDYCFKNTYDFLYIPCDFKNNCNVGYGFINFVNTSYLSDFYLEFHNRGWGKFKSQKICILTYARLQGYNSLIEHFMNSKVLNSKEKKYRPIIKTNDKINNLIKTQQQQ